MNKYGLVLYYSRHGALLSMAQAIANGMEQAGLESKIRTVPEVSPNTIATEDAVPDSGAPYATMDDLKNCAALALGSPAYFGNMAAAMKHFWDSSSSLWAQGALIGKPAGVFTATSTMHGGNESALLSMMTPLLHHGMLITGLSYDNPELNTTMRGGSPYGPTHICGLKHEYNLTNEEKILCIQLGKRLGTLTQKLG